MARSLADYVITTILAHARQAEHSRLHDANDWQLLQLGGVSGRTLGLADFRAKMPRLPDLHALSGCGS